MTGSTEAQTSSAQDSGRDFFNQNLAALKRWAPHLYSRLKAIEAPYTEILLDNDGNIDIGFRGQRLYGRDAIALANEQIENLIRNPVREYINEPNNSKMEGLTGIFCGGLLSRMAEQGITYDPKNRPQDSHFLIVFGVGLGLHLEAAAAHTNAKIVIIIEPHLEFVYQSLFVTDWVSLFENGEADGVRFCLIVEQSPSDIASRCINLMRGNNPVLIDGMVFFTNYVSPILESARDLIRKDLYLAVSGLGYFDDEVIMCRNTARNLGGGPVEILSDYLPAREEPLFIVGSGPSVEADMDFIVNHVDKAIIMTIGTGLRGLLRRGIKPDFHIELENQVFNTNIIAATAADFDIHGITLVGSVTLQKRMVESFDQRILFFREGVSPTKLFGRPFRVVRPAGPTVANAGAVSAIRMGFRDIYLFGVDMGTTMEGRFHSEGSVYGAGILDEMATASIIYPGNFGGDATGCFIFDWSRKVLENTFRYYREVNVYNCSRGVRIAGSIPKVSRAIQLENDTVDRAEVLKDIKKGLVRCAPSHWQDMWRDAGLRQQSERVFGWIEDVIADLDKAPEQHDDWVEDFCGLIGRMQAESPVNTSFMGGTLQLIVGSASWYERRLNDSGRKGDYRRIVAEQLRTILNSLKPRMDDVYGEIESAMEGKEIGDKPDLAKTAQDARKGRK
jgi:hypothetical protein